MWLRVLSSPLLAVALAACGAVEGLDAPVGEHVAELEVVPVLHFEADGSIHASGPLISGGRVRIDYASERAVCRGETRGRPFWGATGRYRINGGTEGSFEAGGIVNDHRADAQVIALPEAGDLEIGFENGNGWGCHANDPTSGRFHFTIQPGPGASGWAGNAASIITRATCEGGCPGFARPLEEGFNYDDWAWSRAAKKVVAFEVWIPGVTDRDNPGLWRDLDVRAYFRYGAVGAYRPTPAFIDGRVGNNVRYTLDLAPLDPFPVEGQPYRRSVDAPEYCPNAPSRETPDGRGLEVELELYFTVNGVPLRPTSEGVYRGKYSTTMYVVGMCAL